MLGVKIRSILKSLLKLIKQLSFKFKKLSTLKKLVLLIIIMFSLLWYWFTKYLYHYFINTIGVPQLSNLTGISSDKINFILFSLPFYIKSMFAILGLLVIILILWKKNKFLTDNTNSTS